MTSRLFQTAAATATDTHYMASMRELATAALRDR
jgi:hypothetical protein